MPMVFRSTTSTQTSKVTKQDRSTCAEKKKQKKTEKYSKTKIKTQQTST